MPGPSPDEAEEQRKYDEAWAAMEADENQARADFNKLVEDARQEKRVKVEAAYRQLRERKSKALQRFHERTQKGESPE